MTYDIDLSRTRKEHIFPLSDRFRGKNTVTEDEISFTNSSMMLNGRPFFGISGECHYARVHESQWEDTILKMKAGGINIIATYVFWIHHEEEEGVFRFDGNRDIRAFVQLCRKHNMYVIVRIGPFCHGEARNGGLPDWLYGKPFEVRALNEGFLSCVRKLYREIGVQLQGLLFKDGGPVIAAQIENEYMHSAAPWEMTTGITNEWVPGGADGNAYLLELKKIALEEGILTPFYTCTAWGGAAMPYEEMLPLWGGYAYWPWIFYDYSGPHPATPEYLYRDNHNSAVKETYNFDPVYDPESRPYACCEMGGGMANYYNYRFVLPFESVDAMANIKLGSGCNFLGYYMYRGGSNPRGEKTPYLNEHQVPKISYDYQAPIGEYGQLRPSYFRLKALHQFLKAFGERLCPLTTLLPEGSQEISPEDTETLRFAVRTDGESGFLFLNNFQDHVFCTDKSHETICLKGGSREILFSDLSLAAGENAILPFGMDVEGYRLICAKAQPLSVIRSTEETIWFFFVPEGMKGSYLWDGVGIEAVNSDGHAGIDRRADGVIRVDPEPGSSFELTGGKRKVTVVTLDRCSSLGYYEISVNGKTYAIVSDTPVQFDGQKLLIREAEGAEETVIRCCPDPGTTVSTDGNAVVREQEGRWTILRIRPGERKRQTCFCGNPVDGAVLPFTKTGKGRYLVTLPDMSDGWENALLQIRYRGDVGHLFENGILIADNFCNGAVWEVGLKQAMTNNDDRELTVLITPRKKDATVNVSSTMAGRLEQLSGAEEQLEEVRFVCPRSVELSLL